MDDHGIGTRVRTERERLGLTRGELAGAAGMTEAALRHIEQGRRKRFAVGEVDRLSAALGAPLADPAPEATASARERVSGDPGPVERGVVADLDGAGIGHERRATEVAAALALARSMDVCVNPARLVSLSRELRSVMTGLMADHTPPAGAMTSAPAPDPWANLGVPVIAA